MVVKEYFRNIGTYEANSMNSFMKRAKINNIKSVDVIIEYLYLNDLKKEISPGEKKASAFSNIDTRIIYEAKPRGYTTLRTRFIKEYDDQYDALQCTEKKIKWLKKKIPNVNITIKNSSRQNIESTYEQLLRVINKNSPAK
jgi:hypothetical protein